MQNIVQPSGRYNLEKIPVMKFGWLLLLLSLVVVEAKVVSPDEIRSMPNKMPNDWQHCIQLLFLPGAFEMQSKLFLGSFIGHHFVNQSKGRTRNECKEQQQKSEPHTNISTHTHTNQPIPIDLKWLYSIENERVFRLLFFCSFVYLLAHFVGSRFFFYRCFYVGILRKNVEQMKKKPPKKSKRNRDRDKESSAYH